MASLGLIATACNKEDSDASPEPNGEKSAIYLTISTDALKTKAPDSGDATHATEGNEGTITEGDGLKVYVFNSNGALVYSSASETNGRLELETVSAGVYRTTKSFQVGSGDNYFFVFANDGTTGGLVQAPTSTTNMETFMKQHLAFALTGSEANTDKFLLASLWADAKNVAAGGTESSPIVVNLGIGRVLSKVVLNDVDLVNVDASLQGQFSTPAYRLGTIPKYINTVGVHYGTSLPNAANNVLVHSAVHNAGVWVNQDGTSETNFTPYLTSTFSTIDLATPANTKFFYTTENTTEPVGGEQFFGNTTFIQLRTVYTPVLAETYDPETLATNVALTNNNFWTATVVADPQFLPKTMANKTIVLGTAPEAGSIHLDIVQGVGVTYPAYTGGVNYHKFVVFDENEGNDVTKNRVLRNHYYEFEVTKFNSIGSNTSVVEPTEPVPTKTTVEVRVNVLPWDKITGGVEVG